ncbi:hypothetical protein, partial [Sorangium cellulosum]|uniref:hypothetical protein n=1 Tax=Sorangium cellulosum TaxID=56 RepID=UPI001F1CAD09
TDTAARRICRFGTSSGALRSGANPAGKSCAACALWQYGRMATRRGGARQPMPTMDGFANPSVFFLEGAARMPIFRRSSIASAPVAVAGSR